MKPQPNQIALDSIGDLAAEVAVAGFPVAFILYFVFGLLMMALFPQPFRGTGTNGMILVVVTSVVVAFAVVIPTTIHLRRKKRVRLQQEENERALRQVTHEAASLTNQLNKLLNDAAFCETKLGVALDEARSWLQASRREYEGNVPGPFWDAIETCAYRLSDYNSLAEQLSNNAHRYYSLLQGQQHTFPAFPVDFANLPDAAPVIDDLYAMVRLGQTADPKPHFYDVWERRREHRLTRQVMIAEFATLRDVITNVGRVLNQTIGGLRSVVDAGMAQLSRDHAATRKVIDGHAREHTKMLDNIQRRRKPLG
jgi:hypothetical protein